MNTDRNLGVSVKFNQSADTAYEFTAMTVRKIEHLKLRSRYSFQPKLYIRTPTDELVSFEADIYHIGDKVFKVNAKLEKVTKIPISFDSKLNLQLSERMIKHFV